MSVDLLGWIAGGILVLGGVCLLYRALLSDRSRGRRRCARCWYDMDAVAGLRCPECGRQARVEAGLRRTRRHKARAAMALGVLLLGCLAAVAPRLIRDPWNTLPTPVLSVVLWFHDDPSDTIFSNLTAALYSGKTTSFDRIMLARGCARRLRDRVGAAPGGIPPMPSGAGPTLANYWYAPSARVLDVIWRLGREARPAIPAVIEVSRTGAAADKMAAISTLVTLWPGTDDLRARVVQCLDEDERTRTAVLGAIATGPRPMDEVVGPILRAVQREKDSAGSTGAQVLARLGDGATPALRALVGDRRDVVRNIAIASLGMRRDAAAVPLLTPMLRDSSYKTRSSTIMALHRIGAASTPALDGLCRLAAEEPRITVRVSAVMALVPIGGGDARVVGALAAALADPKAEVRRAAAGELRGLGPAAAAAEGALAAAAHDSDESVASAARAALEAAGKRQ
ncbi:MAG: HEAT repeat domain-containing protein [Phycisphaerales bacterium]|nr:HEAT repeat domain-containing protein [Phycisphaerales bacterium]